MDAPFACNRVEQTHCRHSAGLAFPRRIGRCAVSARVCALQSPEPGQGFHRKETPRSPARLCPGNALGRSASPAAVPHVSACTETRRSGATRPPGRPFPPWRGDVHSDRLTGRGEKARRSGTIPNLPRAQSPSQITTILLISYRLRTDVSSVSPRRPHPRESTGDCQACTACRWI